MTSFTLTEPGNRSHEVVAAACRGPVNITKRGKRKFVLLTAGQFDRLTRSTAQRSGRVEDLSGAGRDEILAGPDAVVCDAGQAD
ncbi:MAG: type II toxin-antitoxin system prevent-host-death family antitoxin [Alphaproteobacteria bacterium]|nr:type II toxin-antitoxin system prevent-host-death family antitoxin [Alphaproteobacteria bacterium]